MYWGYKLNENLYFDKRAEFHISYYALLPTVLSSFRTQVYPISSTGSWQLSNGGNWLVLPWINRRFPHTWLEINIYSWCTISLCCLFVIRVLISLLTDVLWGLDCHSPLFFGKIVTIERYVLRAAILHECQNYLGGEGGHALISSPRTSAIKTQPTFTFLFVWVSQ